jgi:YVTN family beta-propeller protein
MGTLRTTCSGILLGSLLTAFGQDYLSPCDLDWSAKASSLLVTAHSGEKLLVVDPAKQKVTAEIDFGVPLSGTAVSADGKTWYVTGDGYAGKLFVVDAQTRTIQGAAPVGHTPNSPVLAPDGKTIYICNRFNNEIAFIDLASGETTARVPVLREPVAADITPDGKTLFVANHNPDGPADVDYVASKISAIDTATRTVNTIKLVNGSEGVRGLKISPDGKYVYATHMMARFLVPTTQLERGWVSTDALSIIRVSDQTLLYTILLDDVDQGFPNPWSIAFSEDAKTLIISSAGNHELSLIDLPAVTRKIEAEAATASSPAYLNAHNNLSFLSGIRQRIQLPGNGPRAVVVQGGTAYVANYFSASIDTVALATGRVE